MADDILHVQVCYARPGIRFLRDLVVPAGTTLRQAIEASGVLGRCPEIDLASCRVGIFGKLKEPDVVLRQDDRVEIYRGLIADPKEARRKRAEKRDRKVAGKQA
jgi:putative ubiquitin-RnfH superfamily antitoxin RatB of RatAB toxin-antitoxin module